MRRSVLSSTPFMSETATASDATCGRSSVSVARDLRGHGDDDEPGAREGLRGVGRGPDPLREVDARQPLLVAARGVHLLGDLGVTAPEPHLAPGVGQHGGERGAPAAGPEDGGDDALGAHARSSVPGRRRRSNRSAGACSPRISSSWLVIAGHDALGRLAQRRGVLRAVVEVGEVDGRPGVDRDLLGRDRLEHLAVGRQEPVRAPLGDGDDGRPAREREARDARLADHGPAVRVARERALGEEHDALALVEPRGGVHERLRGARGPAVHGDHPGAGEEAAEHGHLPERGLRRDLGARPWS